MTPICAVSCTPLLVLRRGWELTVTLHACTSRLLHVPDDAPCLVIKQQPKPGLGQSQALVPTLESDAHKYQIKLSYLLSFTARLLFYALEDFLIEIESP